MTKSDTLGEPLVRLAGVSRQFGDHLAVASADLVVNRGDFLAILGPSGCGKTSLLRMIGGFLSPTSGVIEIGGRDVTRLPPHKRPTNMVFQGYGLFPHMTVRQNVEYGLRVNDVAEAEVRSRTDKILALVHLDALAERPAPKLSGGQAQRVALARALVMRPDVLLLDEPLAALDLQLRRTMQEELRRIHRSLGGTFVFVTHDQEEAMGLANRIIVMENGHIVQEGDPAEIYDAPKTHFVASFVGEANFLAGHRREGTVELDIGSGHGFPSEGPDGPVEVMVRPQSVAVGPVGSGSNGDTRILLEGRLVDRVYLGGQTKSVVQVGDSEIRALDTVAENQTSAVPVDIGSNIIVSWSRDRQQVFEGGAS